jgi:hypothetical protein
MAACVPRITGWVPLTSIYSVYKAKNSSTRGNGGAWLETRYSSYSFTTLALDGGEWSASRPGRALPPGERILGTHCTEGWVGPRAGLDTEVRGKINCLCRRSNVNRPVVQPVAKQCTDWATRLIYSVYSLLKKTHCLFKDRHCREGV